MAHKVHNTKGALAHQDNAIEDPVLIANRRPQMFWAPPGHQILTRRSRRKELQQEKPGIYGRFRRHTWVANMLARY